MPVDTSAINTILQAYLAGRGIREKREAEVTRQQERKEDIKRSEEHFNMQQKDAQARFDLEKAIAQINQNASVFDIYEKSGGTVTPPGSQLEGTYWEDQAGNPLEMPRAKEYSFKGISGEPQKIQLPNPEYLSMLEIQRAEEKARGMRQAELGIEEPYKIREEGRAAQTEEGKLYAQHIYNMREIEARGQEQKDAKEAAKKNFDATIEAAATNPEILEDMTKANRDIVVEGILKKNLQWTPPVVKKSMDRYDTAKATIARMKKIPSYLGTMGNLARNLGGDTTSMDLEVQGLRNLLTEEKLGLMRGLGHMSDNDLKVIQGALVTLDVKNKRFKESLQVIEDTVNAASKRLADRAKNPPAPSPNAGNETSSSGEKRPLSQYKFY
jgi:hypothetical protein